MDKHWSQYCTLSIVHFQAFPECGNGEGPILETVTRVAEDPFFDAIEIAWIKDPQVRAATKAVLEVTHMEVGYGAQPSLLSQKLDLNSLDEAERTRAIVQLKCDVDEASEVGSKSVVFLSGKDPGDDDRPLALELLLASIREVCAFAQDKGISLVCETFDREIDKRCLIGPSDYAADFAYKIREEFPDFGILYDLGHQPLLFEQSASALSLLQDVLVHAHVGNCVLDPQVAGYGDNHPRFGWPGGCNDIDELVEFLRALFGIGYLAEGKQEPPWIGFEVKPQAPRETSEQILANCKRVWQQAWWRV